MHGSKFLPAVAAALIVSALAAIAFGQSPAAPSPDVAALQREVRALRAEMESTKRSLATANDKLSKLSAPSASTMATTSRSTTSQCSVEQLCADLAVLKENDQKMTAMMDQWWTALEGWRGSHFLRKPSMTNGRFSMQ